MANPKLTVTVSNGTVPVSIQVKLFKGDSVPVSFNETTSFQHVFENLDPGSYCVSIAGTNPAGGSTDCEISRSGITLHPPDDSPITKNGHSYLVNFNFTVN